MLVQKNSGPGPEVINGATRLFSGLADLNYKPGAYHSEEIFDKYIIRVAEKGFTVVNHPSEIYGIPDAHECIDGNLPLRLVLDIDTRQKPDPINSGLPSLDTNKISCKDLLSRILIAYTDILNSDLNHIVPLNAFTLASSSNTNKCSWHIVYSYVCFIDYRDLRGFVEKVANRVGKPYSEFIDLGLYKSRFSLRLLGSAKGDRVKRPAISSVKEGYRELEDYLVQPKWDASEIWPQTFSSEKPEKDKFQLIEDETTLNKGASLVIAKYEWLEIGNIRKGFINFQARSLKACPICNICHEKDQLYGFLQSNGCFILRCYRQKQYKPDHKGLEFREATKFSAKPKQRIVERIGNAISNLRPFIELSEIAINVEKLRNTPEVYPDFLNTEKTTTLIRSPLRTWKTTALREIIIVLKDKSLSNESKSKLDELKASGFRICNYQNMQGDLSINEWDIIIVQVESLFCVKFTAHPFVAILDEANTIMRQMSSSTNAQESENAMRDVLRSVRHVLAMDAFTNISTLTFLQIYCGENIRVVDNKYQPCIGETVEFIYDPNSGAEAMRIGYDLLRQSKHVAFVSTGVVMARALVKKASKLSKSDNSPVKAHAYYRNMDGKQRQKDFSNIDVAWVELDCVAYTNTVEAGILFKVMGHFDIVIAITNIATPVHVEALAQMLYRIRDSPRHIVSIFYQKNSNELFRPPGHENIRAELETVIIFIKVEYQKRLSARYFIEKLCSLIASTSASLQLIKMDKSRGVIGNRKRIHNEVRVEALVIKETDFNAVATSRNLDPKEAEIFKFDQECSIADTMALKHFYMRNLYSSKDVNIDDWNNLCNKKFMECFSPPKPRKHFLRLSQFRKHGYARENVKKSVAEDLHKLYSANHWKAIRELFQILGFTGIDDIRTLSGNIISEAFAQSYERFIEIRSQSLLLFGFKSRAKEKPDLISAIKTINVIGLGFEDKGTPELPPYKPKTDNDIQELFDSIGQDK
ncbi:9858_t:CDS:2 [Gigaspora margarita]|uniref:9858_t:CDS:1 n=1 Tax=Gigaspora margarita TaxID=4874 RepID=A0ABN7URT1_GIGMA|nr:9858_t:CDS:2 [Gigaspora margarita]